MLRHNVLYLCCVNQSSKDDYFIVAADMCVVLGMHVVFHFSEEHNGYYYFGRKRMG